MCPYTVLVTFVDKLKSWLCEDQITNSLIARYLSKKSYLCMVMNCTCFCLRHTSNTLTNLCVAPDIAAKECLLLWHNEEQCLEPITYPTTSAMCNATDAVSHYILLLQIEYKNYAKQTKVPCHSRHSKKGMEKRRGNKNS